MKQMRATKFHDGSATGIGQVIQADGAIDGRGRQRSLSLSSHSFSQCSPTQKLRMGIENEKEEENDGPRVFICGVMLRLGEEHKRDSLASGGSLVPLAPELGSSLRTWRPKSEWNGVTYGGVHWSTENELVLAEHVADFWDLCF